MNSQFPQRPLNRVSKRQGLKWIGVTILVFWLVMVGLLVQRTRFQGLAPGSAGEAPPITDLEQGWMEIYLQGKKIGYSVTEISPVGSDYLIQEDILLRLNLMGQPNMMRAFTRSLVDHRFLLKDFQFRMTSGIVTFQVSGKVDGEQMRLEIGEGQGRKVQTLRLPAQPGMASGMAQFFKGRMLNVGEYYPFPMFDPSTMTLKPLEIRVVSRESITIHRMEYSAYRLEAEMFGQTLRFWLDDKGAVLKEEGFMGFTLIRSNASKAPEGIEEDGGADFYDLSAVRVKGRLKDPEKTHFLRLRVEGLDHEGLSKAIMTDERQSQKEGVLEVIRERMPVRAGYSLPYPRESMGFFLDPELNIESDASEIIDQARRILGDIQEPVVACRRMLSWVYENIKKKPVLSVPSALQVLETKTGDCNEHATLLTALLRASGIPARVCVGLVYTRDKFFYHAWVEAYLGRWISMDPTLNQMPTDATHLKMVHGGLDQQMEILRVIGRLRFTLLEYG